ncbi:MAG: STAS/SEC14 domain-containing protein [Thiohalospira sp.]
MTFTIQWQKKGAFITFRGIVTSQDLIDANNYLLSNANFEQIDYQVFDFSDIEDFQVTTYDMSILGSMDNSQATFNKMMKVAFVTKDNYVKELITEYKRFMVGTDWKTEIFDDLETAKKWVEKA